MSEKLTWKGDVTECCRWRIQTARERNGEVFETFHSLEVSKLPTGGAPWMPAPGEGGKRELKRKAQRLMDGEDWYSAMYSPPEWLSRRPARKENER